MPKSFVFWTLVAGVSAVVTAAMHWLPGVKRVVKA
jgi:hypothetical protein